MNAALHEFSIAEAGNLMRVGALTSTDLTTHALSSIESLDPQVHAFVLVTAERALADAERADKQFKDGIDLGPLQGIPYGLKDIYATAGIRTTCHSKLLVDHVPYTDSAVEAKLRSGGAVLLGKMATHEFAIGGPSPDLPFPPARNPWNLHHFTGGSSSGGAAAVAAGMMRVAMGSDTLGSIRGPACYCGTIGLKPTYGLVSRRGVFPLSSSLDHCGPLTWSVEDCALALQVVAGYDPLDPNSCNIPIPDYRERIGHPLDGLRIGYAREIFDRGDGVSAEALAAMDRAAQIVARLGATIEQVSLPDLELFAACGRVIMLAEAYAIHEHQLRERARDYGRRTFQHFILGAAISASDLVHAFRLRRELTTTLNTQLFATYDALVTLTALAPAPPFSDFSDGMPRTQPLLTAPFNVSGNPALAMPIGLSESGLPLGMQIVGRAFDEPTVFQIAAAFEAAGEIRQHARLDVAASPYQSIERTQP